MMNDDKPYILGTDNEEIKRLELQHQIWLSEAKTGWVSANFSKNNTILDLGSGPGTCSRELAKIVGTGGKIISVDKSSYYIQHIENNLQNKYPQIIPICSSFEDLSLEPNSIDNMFCRWSLAWVQNPNKIISKIKNYLKTGGKMVFHEYYDWSTHQIFPFKENIDKCIKKALKSFKESDFEIDIGATLPQLLYNMDFNIISTRLMPKLASPDSIEWNWPKTFYYNYFPKLVKMGYLNNNDTKKFFKDFKSLEKLHYARIFCPILIEIIAEK